MAVPDIAMVTPILEYVPVDACIIITVIDAHIENKGNMRYYCDYCDAYLTHDSVRDVFVKNGDWQRIRGEEYLICWVQ